MSNDAETVAKLCKRALELGRVNLGRSYNVKKIGGAKPLEVPSESGTMRVLGVRFRVEMEVYVSAEEGRSYGR